MCSGVNVWDFNCSQHNFFPLAVSTADQDTDSLPRLCVWYVCVYVCVVPGDVQAENSIPGDVSSTKQRLLKITIAPPSFILFFFPPPHLYSAAVSAAVLMLFSPVSFFPPPVICLFSKISAHVTR